VPSSTVWTSIVEILESQLYEGEFCVAFKEKLAVGRDERAWSKLHQFVGWHVIDRIQE
jgi:hypothetical protein